MMDFLRRLAPPRETDATRAVALLPSCFASERPMRAMIGQARPAQRPDDDEALLSLDTTSAPAAYAGSGRGAESYTTLSLDAKLVVDAVTAQQDPVKGVQPSQVVSRPFGIKPTLRDSQTATSPTHAPAEAPDLDVADPRAGQDRHGASLERAKQARPELQGFVAALAASQGLQGVAVPLAQPRVALPLSQAILAQRTLQSRDDGQVVHVTIGRIDVVANTAPAPAVTRSPPPRQATVTLADYLRSGNGSRQ